MTARSRRPSPGSNRHGCRDPSRSMRRRVGPTMLYTIRSPRSSGGWTMPMAPPWCLSGDAIARHGWARVIACLPVKTLVKASAG